MGRRGVGSGEVSALGCVFVQLSLSSQFQDSSLYMQPGKPSLHFFAIDFAVSSGSDGRFPD